MEVILFEEDVRLGDVGDIVKVSDGYGRNFLIPQRRAGLATKSNISLVENQLRGKKKKIEKELKSMQDVAAKVNGLELEFKLALNSAGQLFGSVTNEMIAEKITEVSGVAVDKKKIAQSSHIKNLGRYTAKVKIYSGVIAEVGLVIKEAEKQEEVKVKTRMQRRRPQEKAKRQSEDSK